MARKHLLANLGADTAKPDDSAGKPSSRVDYARRGASRSMMQSLDDLAENSMRVLEGDTIVALDPNILDPSPYADRIGEDYEKDQELLAAIKESGQLSPVLVRPHPTSSTRYVIVFGHRRVRAAKALGREVRAVVKPLEEIAHVVAQGQENSARDDLSFIEKAAYARRLLESGIDKSTIKAALTIDDTLLSRMLSVMEFIPDAVLEALGAAKGVGRDRWEELKKLVLAPVKVEQALDLIVSDEFREAEANQKFTVLIDGLKSYKTKKPASKRSAQKVWNVSEGVKVSTKDSGKAYTLALKSKDASEFGAFLSERLEGLYKEFQKTTGEGCN